MLDAPEVPFRYFENGAVRGVKAAPPRPYRERWRSNAVDGFDPAVHDGLLERLMIQLVLVRVALGEFRE